MIDGVGGRGTMSGSALNVDTLAAVPSKQYSERNVCEALPEEAAEPWCLRQRAHRLLDKLTRRTKGEGECSIH